MEQECEMVSTTTSDASEIFGKDDSNLEHKHQFKWSRFLLRNLRERDSGAV